MAASRVRRRRLQESGLFGLAPGGVGLLLHLQQLQGHAVLHDLVHWLNLKRASETRGPLPFEAILAACGCSSSATVAPSCAKSWSRRPAGREDRYRRAARGLPAAHG